MLSNPERRPHVLDDELMVDAIVGYRAWRIELNEGLVTLRSVIRDLSWPSGMPLRSECRCKEYARIQHSCGIYAWADPIIPQTQSFTAWQHPFLFEYCFFGYVAGEVLLWGEVSVHERGYRAEYALPAALYVCQEMDERRQRVVELAALQYELPVVLVQ